jgi:hypothetical protein
MRHDHSSLKAPGYLVQVRRGSRVRRQDRLQSLHEQTLQGWEVSSDGT